MWCGVLCCDAVMLWCGIISLDAVGMVVIAAWEEPPGDCCAVVRCAVL